MQEYLLDPPLFLPDHRLVADWKKLAVVTAKKIFTRLTPRQCAARDIPEIDGESKPEWMEDVARNVVIVKSNITRQCCFGAYQTVATDKITADLARYMGLRVPHVIIWERTYPRNRKVYFSITPRVFSDCQRAPPPEVLLADKSLPGIVIFDGYIRNPDRTPRNIAYCTTSLPANPLTAYLDNGLADLENLVNYGSVNPVHEILDKWYFWEPSIRNRLEREIPGSPLVQKAIGRIENMPDHFISSTVREVPDALFCSPKSKQRIIDNLRNWREDLRKQVQQSFRLG